MPPTVVDTFSGAGGSSLGYKLAGYKELLAVEFDKNAVDTFHLNFPNVDIYAGDITHLSNELCFKITGLKPGELDVFSGSPPCQGFSKMGNQNLNDSRNQLFRQYVRLLQALQPKVFVMENVKGMITGHMKQTFLEIIRCLRDSGYQVKAQLMNAQYFGVPQSRERVIFIGVRNDLGIEPSHPKPFSRPITVGEALANLKIPDDEPPYTPSPLDVERWHIMPEGESQAHIKYGWMRKAHVKLHRNKICPTIIKTSASLPFHPTEPRRLLVCEAAILTGFPPDFKFIGSREDRVNRIGNCVPPPLMRAIAEHIKTEILGYKS